MQSLESLLSMNVNESTRTARCAGYRNESKVVRSAGYDWFGSTYRGRTVNALAGENSPGAGTSPSVMLSPNARILVTLRRGGGKTTLAMNEQLSVRRTASVAVQVTGVEPILNVEPLGGVQDTDTGVVPPVTVGTP